MVPEVMDNFPTPSPLDMSGNMSDNWKKFKQRMELYMEATGKVTSPMKTRNAIFLTLVGQEALEVYNTFTFKDGDYEVGSDGKSTNVIKYDVIMERFDEYCNPRTNVIFERCKFRN